MYSEFNKVTRVNICHRLEQRLFRVSAELYSTTTHSGKSYAARIMRVIMIASVW